MSASSQSLFVARRGHRNHFLCNLQKVVARSCNSHVLHDISIQAKERVHFLTQSFGQKRGHARTKETDRIHMDTKLWQPSRNP